jgi:hypothetical protein
MFLLLDSSAVGTHYCVSISTLHNFVLLEAARRSTTRKRECIVAFPWQQCSRERAPCYVIRTLPILLKRSAVILWVPVRHCPVSSTVRRRLEAN